MGPDWKLSPAVELELAQAFKSNVPVVPILFREAQIVALTDALPPHIAELKDRNAISIKHVSWHRDVAPLIELIRKVLSEPSRGRVIIDPPDPKRLLEIEPSPFDSSIQLLNYAQDLAECLEDTEVFAEAKDAVVHFETELKHKWEYELEMKHPSGAYQNIRGPQPRLIKIVQAAKKRLQIEQDIRDLVGFDFGLYKNSYELADHYRKVALYLHDDKLFAELAELHQEFSDAVDDFRNGGMSQPSVPKQEFEEIISAAKKRLRAELPGITKRYPDPEVGVKPSVA